MKILNITHSFYPESNAGVELYVDSLSRELGQRHQVMLFTRSKKASEPCREDHGNYSVFAIPRGFSERKGLRAFGQCIEAFNPDVVHIHHLIGLGLGIPALLRKRAIPYIITLHDYWYVCRRIRLITREGRACNFPYEDCCHCLFPKKAWKRQIFRLTGPKEKKRVLDSLNSAACIITPSAIMKKRYEDYGVKNRNFSVLQIGIDTSAIPQGLRLGTAVEHGGRIGYIGTLSIFKGVDVLLKAFSALKKDCTLHLYGKMLKKDEPALRSLIKENAGIALHGEFDHRDLLRVLSSLDMVVVPSVWEETHNIVVDEARAAGIPVIASAIGAIPDRIIDRKNGFLVPPGDMNALKEKMAWVLDNYREALALDMRMNLLTIQQNAAWYEQVYQEISSARRSNA